jgi:hypothetical protein
VLLQELALYAGCMPATDHKLFPLGLLCCHCQTWYDITDIQVHSRLLHPACKGCEGERMLAECLLEDARAAARIVVGGIVDEIVSSASDD